MKTEHFPTLTAHADVKTERWSEEERRLLLSMRRESVSREAIGRILLRGTKAVKTRLEQERRREKIRMFAA